MFHCEGCKTWVLNFVAQGKWVDGGSDERGLKGTEFYQSDLTALISQMTSN